MKISILGIGTELTTGQINNKNAQNISIKMKQLGLPTSVHVVVPDDRELILGALDYCSKNSDLIFVTGGLGPTSDDFTRTVIAEFLNQPLEWHEESWFHVKDLLESREVPVREIQKQQCYFPSGSTVLKNNKGTANAFYIESGDKILIVLPGPPSEIEAIWQDHLEVKLQDLTKDLDPVVTKAWDLLGIGESEIANLVTDILQSFPGEVSYRVHLPYVELKLSYSLSKQDNLQKYLLEVDAILSDYVAAKDGQDPFQNLVNSMHSLGIKNVIFDDQISNGYLLNRWQSLKFKSLRVQFVNADHLFYSTKSSSDIVLKISPASEQNKCLASWIQNQNESSVEVTCSYSEKLLKERGPQYFVERSILMWSQLAFPSKVSVN